MQRVQRMQRSASRMTSGQLSIVNRGEKSESTTFPGTLWLRVVPVGKDGAEGTPLAPVRDESSKEPDSRVDGFVRVGALELIAPPR